MIDILSTEFGVLASWLGVIIGVLSLLWAMWHFHISNKNPRVEVSFGFPFLDRNRPLNFHICNRSKNQIRVEYIEFEVQQRDSYSISTQIELYKINNPMLTEGDILKFSVNGQKVVDRLSKIVNEGKVSVINKLFPKKVNVFVISSVGKRYRAIIDNKVKNTLLEVFEDGDEACS